MKITEKGQEALRMPSAYKAELLVTVNLTVNGRLEGENDQGTGVRPHSEFDKTQFHFSHVTFKIREQNR